MPRRGLPGLGEKHVRIATEPETPHATLVSVVQRKRFAARRRHTDHEPRHECVEYLKAFAVRRELIKIPSGQCDGGHGVWLLVVLCTRGRSGVNQG